MLSGVCRADHILGHQVAQGEKIRPAGQRVVADVEHAARLEFLFQKINDNAPVVVGDPAPDAVQANKISSLYQKRSDLEERQTNLMIFGETNIGLFIAFVVMQIHRLLPTNEDIDVILSLLTPYIIYIIAEKIALAR